MIKAEHIVKKFGDFTALNDISINIGEGKIYGLVGSNGAGKSTLIRVLTGVYRADGGAATFDGENIFNNPSVKKRIAFVPDELYFLPGSNLERMALIYKSAYEKFDMERFKQLLGGVGLDPKRKINTMSKGMKRQAATMLALASRTDCIFFDETFDGLDPVMRNYIKGIISEDVLSRGATAVITSHSLRELEDTCDQLALLHKGGLVVESDIENLKTRHIKVQIGFTDEYDESRFNGINMKRFVKHGSISSMLVPGDDDSIIEKLKAMNPAILDVLPLSLEEVFTYEMETLGYTLNAEVSDK